jgi:hypothetical protein
MTAEKKKAQQGKILLSMTTMCQAECIDAVAKCKKTNRGYIKRYRKAESIDKSAKRLRKKMWLHHARKLSEKI